MTASRSGTAPWCGGASPPTSPPARSAETTRCSMGSPRPGKSSRSGRRRSCCARGTAARSSSPPRRSERPDLAAGQLMSRHGVPPPTHRRDDVSDERQTCRGRGEDRPVRAAGAVRRVDCGGDLLVSGTVYGIAGGSVEDLGTDAAKAGRAGEESTGRVLDRIAAESQRDVWHDLHLPARGIVANIDHIVTGGTVALIIDAKRWRPGLYWTLDGTSFRWLAKVEHADRSTMSMIQQRIAAHIPRALVRR